MKSINYLLFFVLILISSCKKEKDCDPIICNDGVMNEETCSCDCNPGFSGYNCQFEDLCITQNVSCLNGGTCMDGSCDCAPGFVGDNCELYDPAYAQFYLDEGKSPLELFEGGIPLDSLYGKQFEGGILFFLDTSDGTGMIAAQVGSAEFGCFGTDIPDLPNDASENTGSIEGEGAQAGDGATNTEAILNATCGSSSGTAIAAELCHNHGEGWYLPSSGEFYLIGSNVVEQGGLTEDFYSCCYWTSTEGSANNAWVYYLAGVILSEPKNEAFGVMAIRNF